MMVYDPYFIYVSLQSISDMISLRSAGSSEHDLGVSSKIRESLQKEVSTFKTRERLLLDIKVA